MTAAAPRHVAVSLEEFFEGNGDPASLWSNCPEPIPLSRAYTRLRKIRARDDVHDVRIVLTQFDGGETEWPSSDTIVIVTSRDKKAVRGWLGRGCPPDEMAGEDALANLAEPIEIPAGMRVIAAWWD